MAKKISMGKRSGLHGTRMSMNRYLKKNEHERRKHRGKGIPLDTQHHDLSFGDAITPPNIPPVFRADNSPEYSEMVNNTPAPDSALCNIFLAALADPQRGYHGYKKGRYTEANRRQMQMQMIEAQRFVMDEKLVEHVVAASLENPDYLVKAAMRAIPPFETMWIEWPERHKVNTLREHYAKKYPDKQIDPVTDVPHQLGYMIQRLNGHFLYTAVCEFVGTDGKIKSWANGTSFYFSNDEPITYDWAHSPEMHNDLIQDTPDNWLIQNFQAATELLYPAYIEEHGTDHPAFDWLGKRVMIGQSSSLGITDEQYRNGWSRDWMVQKTRQELRVLQGDLRFLICALAFLNYDHIVVGESKHDPKIRHTRYGRSVPENEYRTVTIELPKRCKKIRRGILTGAGSPQKQHWRKGHWRAVAWDDLGNVTKHTWIAPYQAGNPELGVIVKDYDLRGKKG